MLTILTTELPSRAKAHHAVHEQEIPQLHASWTVHRRARVRSRPWCPIPAAPPQKIQLGHYGASVQGGQRPQSWHTWPRLRYQLRCPRNGVPRPAAGSMKRRLYAGTQLSRRSAFAGSRVLAPACAAPAAGAAPRCRTPAPCCRGPPANRTECGGCRAESAPDPAGSAVAVDLDAGPGCEVVMRAPVRVQRGRTAPSRSRRRRRSASPSGRARGRERRSSGASSHPGTAAPIRTTHALQRADNKRASNTPRNGH